METFEKYAERVISGLSDPEPIGQDKYNSPLEGVLTDLEGELLEINDSSKIRNIDDLIKPDEINDVENGVLSSGLEALAFYKSIHHKNSPPFLGKWGIFIFDYSLNYLQNEISAFYPGRFMFNERIDAAFWLLYFHERFHYRFDRWAISIESATAKPLYENYRNSVYRSFHPSIFIYEESLANLHSLASVARYGIHEFAKQFMLSQPGAYSNIIGIDRDLFRSSLAAQLLHGRASILGVPASNLPEHSQYLASPKDGGRLDKECPTFIIRGVAASRFVIPSIALPTVKEIESGYLAKYLDGREIQSDHKYFVIDNGEKVKCPNPHNKNLRLREFDNIIKKSGITKDEYFKERVRTKKWKKDVPRNSPKPSLLRVGA